MALQWLCVVYFILLFDYISGKEDIWYSYQFNSGHGNREGGGGFLVCGCIYNTPIITVTGIFTIFDLSKELVISKVDAVNSFKTERIVNSWRTLSLKHKSYALGLTENGVIALQAFLDKDDNLVTNSSHIEMNGTIIDAFLFENFNNTLYTNDIIAVIAIKNHTNNDVELKGFKFTDDNQLVCGWTQSWMKNITHLNIFKINNKWHILICNDRYKNYTTADLYEFILGKKPDFWLIQKIDLIVPTKISTITTYGINTYLSIPQTDQILIFKYETNHFVPEWTLAATNATYTTSFKIGFHAFLAIDGQDAGIYKFTESGFIKQDIQDANLNRIDYWMSIPVRTYRDDEILIAERFLDHGSHRSYDIQVILYNEGRFIVHEEMECFYYGEMVHGMNCIVDEEKNSVGIKGSAYLILGDVIGMLIPRNHTTSRLFRIHVELKDVESPLEKQIKALNSFRKKLESKIEERKEKLNNLKHSLEYSVKSNEENIISAPWKINTLAAPVLQQSNNEAIFNIPETNNLQHLFDKVAFIRNSISKLNDDIQQIQPLELRNTLKTLIVKGPVEVHGLSNVETIEVSDFNDGFNFSDIVGINDDKLILSEKSFSNVVIEELSVKNVNGINADEFLFADQDLIEVNGDVIFGRDVTVTGNVDTNKLNDGNILNDLVTIGEHYEDEITFENIIARGSLEVKTANKVPIHDDYLNSISGNIIETDIEKEEFESIYVPGNITVETINGEDFNGFLSKLSLRNLKFQYIPEEIEILGSINAVQSEIGTLNKHNFSSEYVFANGNLFTTITGEKVFNNEIRIKELTTEGDVNGMNTANIITLSDDQKLFGKLTFDQLSIIKSFNITGNINVGLNKSLINPTLLETNRITADCNFKNLEVQGQIKILNNLNEVNFKNILSDMIYKTEEEVEIASIKEFPNGFKVRKNLILDSKAINTKPIKDFVNRNRDEKLNLRTLNGDVTFENLNLLGNFDGVNISELLDTTVKVSGEQFITANLIFENGITVNDLNITKTLNDLELKDYLFTDGARVMEDSEVDSENVEVENLIILGDLKADALNFDIQDFDERRLSLSKEQDISGDAIFKNSKIENFSPLLVNGINFEHLFSVDFYAEDVKRLLQNGNITVKEMLVEDSLNITRIDNIAMKNILKNCVWTDERDNRLSLKLKGNVEFNSLQTEILNGVNFTEFTNNLVFKNETDVTFTATKFYSNGLEVFNYISTPIINEFRVENILRTGGEQAVKSQIWINGDVSIMNDFQMDKLNNVTLDDVNTIFEAVDENTYKIMGHVDFDRVTYINNLTLASSINQENINDFFGSIININDDTNLTANIKFEKPVMISGNLAAKNLVNGIDINNIKEDVVFLTQDVSVDGLVIFTEDLVVSEMVEVDKDLNSPTVMEIDLRKWMEDSVFINLGKIPGILHFEQAIVENNIVVNSINNVDVKSLIPLRLDETILLEFSFGELSSFRDIVVNNLVNGRKLTDEYHNSVMAGKIQEIISDVIFNSNVLVHSGIDLFGLINGHDISKLVTLDGNEELGAVYHFTNRTTILKDMFVYGNINGVNMTDWINKSVKKFSPNQQTITNPWNIDSSLIFGNNVISNGTINGLDIRSVADKVEEIKLFKNNVEIDLIKQYETICENLNGIVTAAKKQIFLFEYLDYHQILDFQYSISNIHQFKFQDFYYMLATDDTSCVSELFFWNGTIFSSVKQIETGKIAQMITVRDGDLVFLVSRHHSDRSCNFVGANIWKVSIDNIQVLYAIDECTYIQESIVPGTFYTLDGEGVTEYKLITTSETNVRKVRRWNLDTANAAFIPRGINYGLSLRNGKNLIKLSRDEAINEQDLGLNYNTIDVIDGNVTWLKNHFLPGKHDGEMIVMNVGYPRRKTLVAVSTLEMKSYRNNLKKVDYINIFDDVKKGKVFNKILATKPTSLLSLEFGDNGETLLVFLENRERLNVYEYKGIEGFKKKISVKIQGSKLIHFLLPFGENGENRSFIGVINKDRLTLLQAVMEGDQIIDEKLQCTL